MENRAALVCFGEVNSPKELGERAAEEALRALQEAGLSVVTTAPVSDDPQRKEARRAVEELADKDFDVLILCLTGWIPSYTVVSVAEAFRNKVMVLWGLAGWKEGDTLVTLAGQAGTTALRYPLTDMGFSFKYFYESIDTQSRAADIARYVHAAAAAKRLRNKRILSIGYRDMNLYGTLYEGISLRKTTGLEVENREMLEMVRRSESVGRKDIEEVLAYIKKNWSFSRPVDDAVLETAAAYYRAVEAIAEEEGYEAVTIIDVDGVKKHLGFPPAAVFMLLADRTGLCTVPENDIMGAATQLIVKELTGQAAAYLEFYEFMSDRVLIGVPDFVPAEICEGGVKVTGASFGNLGAGVLNISKVKTGRVTMCRCVYSGGRYYMHLETGRAVEARKWKEAGWDSDIQLPSIEVILDNPVEDFAQKVCSQHTIIAYGDQRGLIEDYCKITGIELL